MILISIIFSGLFAFEKSIGVTLFTLSSVHWALNNTAISSSYLFEWESGSGISGSLSQNVDVRAALGGVTGSFFGPLRGITSESFEDRITSLEGGSGTTLSATAISGANSS